MSKPNALTEAQQQELYEAANQCYYDIFDIGDASDWAIDEAASLVYYAIGEVIEEGNLLDPEDIAIEAMSRTDDEFIELMKDPRACPEDDEDGDEEGEENGDE